jgi:hypothetical protein
LGLDFQIPTIRKSALDFLDDDEEPPPSKKQKSSLSTGNRIVAKNPVKPESSEAPPSTGKVRPNLLSSPI